MKWSQFFSQSKVLRFGIPALLLISMSFFPSGEFLHEQLKFTRVRTAALEKQDHIDSVLLRNKMKLNRMHIMMVAYKAESMLEIYARDLEATTFKKVFKYKICSLSGILGPKRRQGDGQVPEGFYEINRFNPTSHFYLSLGINYPNGSDMHKSQAVDKGGDIFIHGSCATIGCLPMTDNYIKEIYLLAVHAMNNGQAHIPVYIFPFRMTNENRRIHDSKFSDRAELMKFWDNLEDGYQLLVKTNQELRFNISKNGDYQFLNPN